MCQSRKPLSHQRLPLSTWQNGGLVARDVKRRHARLTAHACCSRGVCSTFRKNGKLTALTVTRIVKRRFSRCVETCRFHLSATQTLVKRRAFAVLACNFKLAPKKGGQSLRQVGARSKL